VVHHPGRVRPRVLYICGWGRSGSTLIDRILGGVPGFVSIGELRSMWDTDPAQQLCGCGTTIQDCPLWGPVLDDVLEAGHGYTTRTVRSLRDEGARSRHLLRLWRQARRVEPPDPGAVTTYGDILEEIYRAVLSAAGAGVVVDSSKHPAEALLLAGRAGVDLTVLHLVRDPRAVAYSWSKRTSPESGVPDSPPRRGVLPSAAWWTAWNAAAEALVRPRVGGRFLALRYEDVIASPRQELGYVVQRMGMSPGDLSLVGDNDVVLPPAHIVAGNPSRHRSGTVHLEPDLEWERSMRRRDRMTATVAALPLLGRYHYPLGAAAHRHLHAVRS